MSSDDKNVKLKLVKAYFKNVCSILFWQKMTKIIFIIGQFAEFFKST